ncbi:hypothetical protein QJ48_31695 [Paenibacillus sp. A3]|nr:hypothetical protein QJ48_31695 [Paenibacillus sp. A3]
MNRPHRHFGRKRQRVPEAKITSPSCKDELQGGELQAAGFLQVMSYEWRVPKLGYNQLALRVESDKLLSYKQRALRVGEPAERRDDERDRILLGACNLAPDKIAELPVRYSIGFRRQILNSGTGSALMPLFSAACTIFDKVNAL